MAAQVPDSDGVTDCVKDVIKLMEEFKQKHLNSLTMDSINTQRILELRIDFIEMMINIENRRV